MLGDREPVIRRISRRIGDRATKLRNRPSQAMQRAVPQVGNRNVGGGIGVGLVQAGVAVVLEETLGLPFGSDVEVTDTRQSGRGTIYSINVDAPTENMARARSFLEANTGFTSILTNEFDVSNVEIISHRPLRDTYQMEVLVEP